MEESIVCYICYEPDTENSSYLKEPPPCECKGSIVIHKQCFEEIIKTSRICSICKTKYKINKNYLFGQTQNKPKQAFTQDPKNEHF